MIQEAEESRQDQIEALLRYTADTLLVCTIHHNNNHYLLIYQLLVVPLLSNTLQQPVNSLICLSHKHIPLNKLLHVVSVGVM